MKAVLEKLNTMKEVLEKLKNISTAMGVELAKGTDADFAKLTELAGQHGQALKEAGGGLEGTEELAKQVAQMRADLDSTSKQLSQIRSMGLRMGGDGVVKIPEGLDRRIEMLKDKRAFASDETAARFGAWAAMRIFRPGQEPCKRIQEIAADVAKQMRTEKSDADIDYSSGTGAELMSNEFRAELIRNVEAVGTVFPLCRRVPLNTMGTTTYPKRTAGLTSYWTDLAAAILRSGIAFGTVTMQPKKVGTLTAVPNEMLRDPMLLAALGQLIGVEIVYAMADRLDHTVLNGDGTADHGGFTGILQSATISSVAAAAGNPTIALLDPADIDNVMAGLTGYALTNARWVMSLSVLMGIRAKRTTAGDPIFDRGGNGFPANVDGFPFTTATRMPAKASVTAGVKYAIFGDLKLAMYVGMIAGISIDRSEHVLFAEDMTAYRGVMHVAVAEADADGVVTGKTTT